MAKPFNSKKLIGAKGVAELSDAEFDRVMICLENHTIYESLDCKVEDLLETVKEEE